MGTSLPSWLLNSGTVLLRHFVRSESDPLCDPVHLLEANQIYSVIRHADGRRTAVSTSDLAPHLQDSCPVSREDTSGGANNDCNDDVDSIRLLTETDFSVSEAGQDEPAQSANHYSPVSLRRSTRVQRPPGRYGECAATL